MKTVIHVDQFAIRRNVKNKTNEPAITVKTYKENHKCHHVTITGGVVKVIQNTTKPLTCGARVWIECDSSQVIVD